MRWGTSKGEPGGTAGVLPLLLLSAGALLGLAAPAAAQERDPLLERAASNRARGHDQAPVLVYEIADFQCPYCARFSRDVFPHIDSAYVRSGQVQWVFVNLPHPSHRHAWAASEAALCAGGVASRFWPMHDRLFADQDEWASAADPLPVFLRFARELDIPVEPFRACLLADKVAPILLEDVIFAASARVSGTPTFVIDRERAVIGYKRFEEWRELIEAALRKKNAGPP